MCAKQEFSKRSINHKKEPSRNPRTEEYNERYEKFKRDLQHMA